MRSFSAAFATDLKASFQDLKFSWLKNYGSKDQKQLKVLDEHLNNSRIFGQL